MYNLPKNVKFEIRPQMTANRNLTQANQVVAQLADEI